ncbi:MAG: ribbon-helix-helix domain-containing protein [Christensenellales bacterium]|nr:ribbon-helix-helix domain-containing protein [Christensenellales bacterium]
MSRGAPIMTLRLDPKLHHQLKEIAANEKTTVSDLVREAINELLQKKKNRP